MIRRWLVLPVALWLAIIWAPKITEALSIKIGGTTVLPNGAADTGELATAYIAGTYGTFSISDVSGKKAKISASTNSSLNKTTLTNSIIKNNGVDGTLN